MHPHIHSVSYDFKHPCDPYSCHTHDTQFAQICLRRWPKRRASLTFFNGDPNSGAERMSTHVQRGKDVFWAFLRKRLKLAGQLKKKERKGNGGTYVRKEEEVFFSWGCTKPECILFLFLFPRANGLERQSEF